MALVSDFRSTINRQMLKGLTKGQLRCVDSISIDMVRAPMPISSTMDSRHLPMATHG